jgi:integrase
MGLGSTKLASLAEARDMAIDARRLLRQGVDPIENSKVARAEVVRAVTFRECAESYIRDQAPKWKNPKHRAQWQSTLETYAYPVFGDLPVGLVDVGLVLKALKPIWLSKTETAGRLRGRIEAVIDSATVLGYREGENPAMWRGRLDKVLPSRADVRPVNHHPALPFSELPAFLVELNDREGIAARALEVAILTATRTAETIGARWSEIDFDEEIWSIPAERMKNKREHRIPLSGHVLEILAGLPREGGADGFVFIGGKMGKPLSNMSLLATLKRMGRGDITTHGFRSTFRDWASEKTNHPGEVVEMALAHTISSKVEAAYRRGDLFEKRRRLMADWSRYCAPLGGNDVIVPLRGNRA